MCARKTYIINQCLGVLLWSTDILTEGLKSYYYYYYYYYYYLPSVSRI